MLSPASHCPRATTTAGPVSCSSALVLGHSTSCSPPGANTRSRDGAPSSAIMAAALALVPVPEEEVGPTPRS